MQPERPTVLLIHGLARTARSMHKPARRIQAAGFPVDTLSYASRKHTVDALLHGWLLPRLRQHRSRQSLHLVTHSLGGILALLALHHWEPPAGSRMVLLAPPCRGSEMVDHLRDRAWFRWFFGPAARQLGTDETAVWRNLPAMSPVPVGIIAGSKRAHPFWRRVLPEPNDGTVSVAATEWDGATDHRVVPASHPFIMNHPETIRHTLHFLKTGAFCQAPDG